MIVFPALAFFFYFLFTSLPQSNPSARPRRSNRFRIESIPLPPSSPISYSTVADNLVRGKYQNIVVFVGAGASVASGLPDFRSTQSGIYENAHQYDIPYPTALFEHSFFLKNPRPFFEFCRDFYPSLSNAEPGITHWFLRLLYEKGLLMRVYTQNIDGLEKKAGLPQHHVVQWHGTYESARCTNRACEYACANDILQEAFAPAPRHGQAPALIPTCPVCKKGIVKPDITLFGEAIPPHYVNLATQDLAACDLLLILGTSLRVEPFSKLMDLVPPSTPRVVINKEPIRCFEERLLDDSLVPSLVDSSDSQDAPDSANRDILLYGTCEDILANLTRELGWDDEFDEIIRAEGANSGPVHI
eukprot:gnl/Trimastix_PCT/1117.p1 GENE.gnl/Trimastix_PCT/1117~~gnl/Trimastix_PCT/1117.p1  ORF type:complete len:358 (-),score=63.84 gnl/Trimastix_PCT/1117:278-1351(-)